MKKRILQLSALVLGLGVTGVLGCQSPGGGAGGMSGCGQAANNNNTPQGACNPVPNCDSASTHQSGCVCVAN